MASHFSSYIATSNVSSCTKKLPLFGGSGPVTQYSMPRFIDRIFYCMNNSLIHNIRSSIVISMTSQLNTPCVADMETGHLVTSSTSDVCTVLCHIAHGWTRFTYPHHRLIRELELEGPASNKLKKM